MKVFVFFSFLFFDVSLCAQTEDKAKAFLDSFSRLPITLIGHSIPEFCGYSNNNKFYTAEDLKNKVTVINIWYEACAPCIAEMEALNNLYFDFKKNKNFQFFSFTYETTETINKIVKKYNICYPVISTSRDSCYILNFHTGFPTMIVSDTLGKVAYYGCGGSLDPIKEQAWMKQKLYPIIEKLLYNTK